MMSKSPHQKHGPIVSSLLGRFCRFLKQPVYSVNVPPQQQPLRDILSLIALEVFISIPLGYILNFLAEEISTGHALADIANQPWLLFLGVVCIAPPLEELLFRLPLRYTPTNLTFPACIWLLLILILLNSVNAIPDGLGFSLLCLAIFGCLFLGMWLNQNIPSKTIHKFYEKKIKFFFYSSSIFFGLIHISNFQLNNEISLLFAPLLVIPQTIGGMQLAFIRLRYGFWWCVFAHAFGNFILIGFILPSQSTFSILPIAVYSLCFVVVINMLIEWRAEKKAFK